MPGTGIRDGDIPVVDHAQEAAHGRMVIAALDDATNATPCVTRPGARMKRPAHAALMLFPRVRHALGGTIRGIPPIIKRTQRRRRLFLTQLRHPDTLSSALVVGYDREYAPSSFFSPSGRRAAVRQTSSAGDGVCPVPDWGDAGLFLFS